MGFRYQHPDNEDAFEQMCLRFYRKLWENESLQLYAKRGEKQDGVDIHDPVCLKPVRAVQCKFHESTKNLPPSEIKGEVAKAERSSFSIEQYVIATTAKKSKKVQDTVVELNRRLNKQFTVELHFWEEICERLSQLPPIQAYFIVCGRDTGADVLASILQDPQIAAIALHVLSPAPTDISSSAYSEIEQLLLDRKFEAAEHSLRKLPLDDNLTKLPKDEQYKVRRLRAKLAPETGSFEEASKQFLAAYELQPELDQAKQNRVLGYSLISDSQKAFELAKQYLLDGLTTPMMLCRFIENAPSMDEITERRGAFHALHINRRGNQYRSVSQIVATREERCCG